MQHPESSFFRALNAPFVATPFLEDEPDAGMPLSMEFEPLSTPIYTSTPEWEWLHRQPFYDIQDLATLHDNRVQKTTVRGCRVADRTLAYMNKLWKIDIHLPGIAKELWLYKFPLKDLMGECVPRLIAIRTAGTFNLAFELPHQTFLIEPSADMPEVLKRRVLRSLLKLHAIGVCHNALTLDNILIGADGNVYLYNFHHARYIRSQPALDLKEAKEIDFALEKRGLEFRLDYENARKKEKDRLASALQRQRSNDIELSKQKIDPSYEPKLIMPDRTPLTLPRFEAWFNNLDREPRRFIMPGQAVEDFEWELKRFYNTLQKMEKLDSAAGLTQPLTPKVDTPVKTEPSTVEEKMIEFGDEVMAGDDILASNECHRPLKRKRLTEMEESSSSRPPAIKRLRQTPTSTCGPSTYGRTQFKNDELRPVKLVSSYEIQPSIQENNLVTQWPVVVVRDFQKQPPPELGAALDALVKRNCNKFKEELDPEKARRDAEQKSGSSWMSFWNPLRHLFWGSQDDKNGQAQEEKEKDPTLPPPLRRHETFLSIPATLNN